MLLRSWQRCLGVDGGEGGGVREQDGAGADDAAGVRAGRVHGRAGGVLACGGGGRRCPHQVGAAVPAMPARLRRLHHPQAPPLLLRRQRQQSHSNCTEVEFDTSRFSRRQA